MHLFSPIMGRSEESNMGLTILESQYLVNYSFWVIKYYRRPQGKNGTPKGWRQLFSLWGTRKWAATNFFNLPQTTLQSYVKDQQESSSKAIKQNWVVSKFFLVKEKMTWLSTVFWWKESFGAWQWQTSCFSLTNLLYEMELKTNFAQEMKRLEGRGSLISYVVIKKFQLQPLKVFTLKSEGVHSWIISSVFLNRRTRNVHHST